MRPLHKQTRASADMPSSSASQSRMLCVPSRTCPAHRLRPATVEKQNSNVATFQKRTRRPSSIVTSPTRHVQREPARGSLMAFPFIFPYQSFTYNACFTPANYQLVTAALRDPPNQTPILPPYPRVPDTMPGCNASSLPCVLHHVCLREHLHWR